MPDEFVQAVIKQAMPRIAVKRTTNYTDSVIPLSLDQTLSDYFYSVLRYFSLPAAPSKSLLKLKFKELILNIITKNYNPVLTDYFREICSVKKWAIKAIMEENFMFNFPLEDYAGLCGRSLAAF